MYWKSSQLFDQNRFQIQHMCVHKLYKEESDREPAVHRPKLVTETGLIVRQ